MFTRVCDLDTCHAQFQTDNPRKTYCSRQHSTLARMRRLRAKRRKGGGGGGGNGGGGGPTLFDELVLVDPQATLPVIGHPQIPSKPAQPIRHAQRRKAA